MVKDVYRGAYRGMDYPQSMKMVEMISEYVDDAE